MQPIAGRLALRVVFVLIGAALALAVALVDITVVALLLRDADLPTWAVVVLATVLVVVLSQAFPVYLGFMGGGFAVYKTLGVFFLLMTWFYFLGIILVLGAQINAFLAAESRSAGDDRLERSSGPQPWPG